jgi:hypothetical protein
VMESGAISLRRHGPQLLKSEKSSRHTWAVKTKAAGRPAFGEDLPGGALPPMPRAALQAFAKCAGRARGCPGEGGVR